MNTNPNLRASCLPKAHNGVIQYIPVVISNKPTRGTRTKLPTMCSTAYIAKKYAQEYIDRGMKEITQQRA